VLSWAGEASVDVAEQHVIFECRQNLRARGDNSLARA
jgi:hypothetical protein